ncbi:LysR family transcriptional regulator [Herbiconiux daphne]|uniref:LysR family transcriptional regulator n=1 Tax=Herbiconiux daphne TaxID=2970914 RepID=A0ABT2GWI1_9MICO|nr:LysR family transcriptional regulator [Herbiconiux daphne]MCS5732317.1 LysR family transcriptional regulator [Herbiconiux daphne]
MITTGIDESDRWVVAVYDLHRLRLLRELSLRGTLAAVAQALGYSPSAVSHQLAVLEREVGSVLLEPAGRGVRLTLVAHQLVAHTEMILTELERAEAGVASSRSEVAGAVRIATFQTAAHVLLPAVVRQLTAAHPDLTIAFSHVPAHAAVPGLLARDFDVVLSERYPGEPPTPLAGVVTEPLMTDPLMLAISTSWPARSIADLADTPWVMEHPGSSVRRWTDAFCGEAGFSPRVAFESADVYLHAELAGNGLAASFLPGLSTHKSGKLQLIPTGAARTIDLSIRTGSGTSPVIAAVTQALHAAR